MGTVWRSDLGVSEKSEVGQFSVDALGHFYCVANSVPYVPPVYELMSKRYVLLRNIEETDKAQRLATELGAKVVLP